MLCFDVFEFDFLLFAVHLDTVRVMTFYISDVLILVFRLCSLLMSTDKEFDCSWEDIKRIDREWKQSWYEFGYQTLQRQMDDLEEEIREEEVQLDLLREQFWEMESRGDHALQCDATLGQLLTLHRIYHKKLATKHKRKEEEELQFHNDPKWMSFYCKAEVIIEKSIFNQSK